MKRFYDGEVFEQEGKQFRVDYRFDESADAPWERGDMLGEVSDWTTRDKGPGERVLNTDRSSKRYYDFAGAVKNAKEQGADAEPFTGTAGERAARAAEAEYEYLRRWCNDQWHYVGVIVTLLDDEGEDTSYDESVWGIEDDSLEYLAETAEELAGEILARLDQEQEVRLNNPEVEAGFHGHHAA